MLFRVTRPGSVSARMRTLLLQGPPAHGASRLAALLHSVRAAAPDAGVDSIDAVEVFPVELAREPDDTEMTHAFALLGAERHFDRKDGFFVTPRKGTLSPWSSKATDIFHNCGVRSVARVERGTHLRVLDADGTEIPVDRLGDALGALHDRMTEGVYTDLRDFFVRPEPASLRTVPLMEHGPAAFREANQAWGLALSDEEIDYLAEAYRRMGRDPTDVELVMFSQVNSEHCRHKIFNAEWVVDGEPSERSLFEMIRHTHRCHPDGVRSAYADNSGVLAGFGGDWWEADPAGPVNHYRKTPATLDILCKVETHNHPTAISPFPGAATGVGGEIRDEGATGTGGRSKAGLSAYMVSDLRIPDYPLPWEAAATTRPARLATPLEIMLEGPIGGAAFGNEFGRPQLCGVFRTLDLEHGGTARGYLKPVMAAGGMGNLKRQHVEKQTISDGALIIQLGGPAMKIGLGGGAASSIGAGAQSEDLDFDSVQRGNPEMQRRCQQVIDGCIALGDANPIRSIHDIGAGGLSNGLPELVEPGGGRFRLRDIHNEDRSMSPMEIWCNEAQERYVLAVPPERIRDFEALCRRERCPFAIVGEASGDGRLVLEDSHFGTTPIDMEMGVLLGKPPRMRRDVTRAKTPGTPLQTGDISLGDAIDRVLRLPAVADKTFLITIADRSVTGMVARDQMAGPWQTPIADVAVTASALDATTGEAMAIGERTPVAVLDAPASGRMAIGECLTNLAAAGITAIGDVKLSANWMVAAGEPGEDADLFDTVKAVAMDLCPALGICIPVGKDSMSMRTEWTDAEGRAHKQVSPLSLMVTGFTPVGDVRKPLTPDLKSDRSALLCIDLGAGRNRLGGSALAQAYGQTGDTPPDLDDPEAFKRFFAAIGELVAGDHLLAYHDRSDGGLLATVAEMAIAGRRGVDLVLDKLQAAATGGSPGADPLPPLFTEELGAVLEVDKDRLADVTALLAKHGLSAVTHLIGGTTDTRRLTIALGNETRYEASLTDLHRTWSELSFHMRAHRDDPACAREEYGALLDEADRGLRLQPAYPVEGDSAAEASAEPPPPAPDGPRPKVAILREQGVNGHNEMAFAFHRAGFDPVDVHMTDLLAERVALSDFAGLAACGGFSYGDVLGAGAGWAKSILYNDRLRDAFRAFFERPDSFTLGVCNGCQMIAQLKELIPGAEHWPEFARNRSEQFEARTSCVEVPESPSIFFRGMAGSRIPVPVAHGEGRADFSRTGSYESCRDNRLIGLRYIDGHGDPAEHYPANPNGSPSGATAFTTPDGRATILMPHPERCFRSVQMSYRPKDRFTGEAGPWLRFFQNARAFVG